MGIEKQLQLGGGGLEVVASMVGDDDDGVVLAEIVERRVDHVQVVVAAAT